MGEPRRSGANLLLASDGRLRTVWRVLLYLLLLLALTLPAVVLISLLHSLVTGQPLQPEIDESLTTVPGLLAQIGSFLAITLATIFSRRLLDRRSFVSLGVGLETQWQPQIVLGVLLGLALISLVFLVQLALGWIEIRGFAWESTQANADIWNSLFIAFAIFVIVGWNEELMTRGYLLQNILEAWGVIPSVLLTSLLFGMLHIVNPSATLAAAVNISLVGVLFAMAYLFTGSLWLPIAFHFSWNFFQGPVFGFPVSGIGSGGLLVVEAVGPEVATGGAFGPEAGLVGLFSTVLGIIFLWTYRWRLPGRPVEAVRSYLGSE